jgi:hypothetical protein
MRRKRQRPLEGLGWGLERLRLSRAWISATLSFSSEGADEDVG